MTGEATCWCAKSISCVRHGALLHGRDPLKPSPQWFCRETNSFHHMHFLWRLPDNDHDFPTRMAQLKTGFTRRLPEHEKARGRKGERGVWQSRFWEHCIRDGSLGLGP